MPADNKNILNRKRLITLIHVAKNKVGLDEDDYRLLLHSETGKDSCSKMGAIELDRVYTRMKALGFKAKPANKLSPKTRNNADKTIVDKIRALWISMHKAGFINDGSEAALNKWVQRCTKRKNGLGISQVDWLLNDMGQANAVLESLKKWQRRARLANV